jgi:phage tail-like protein
MAEGDSLVRTFNFLVTLLSTTAEDRLQDDVDGGRIQTVEGTQKLGDGGFQECSGLEIEQDVQEYLEGGRNFGVVKRVGRAKFQNIVLKRGMFFQSENQLNRDMWNWMQDVVRGVRPIRRYDGIIEVFTKDYKDGTVVARWEFDRGLPAKIVGPQLNAKTGEVAIEELHIAHEGLRLASVV